MIGDDGNGGEGSSGSDELKFRTVLVDGKRRGIRLERVFWDILSQVARQRGIRLGQLIADVDQGNASNLTASLRVIAIDWCMGQLGDLRRITGSEMLDALIQASPAPAIALRDDKKIHLYNQAFANYLQRSMLRFSSEPNIGQVRFSLDTQVKEIASTLQTSGNKPTAVGFLLGVGEGKVRGQMSACLAPFAGEVTILGYVL